MEKECSNYEKILLLILLSLFYFASICNAEAFYYEDEDSVNGITFYQASITDRFYAANIGISIGKIKTFIDDYPFYMYKVIIINDVPVTLTVKELTILSEFDSVIIPESDFKKRNRKVGIDFVQDVVIYSGDPGKINRVIEGCYKKMIIKIKTINNKVYTLYPSKEFISGLKQVARWS